MDEIGGFDWDAGKVGHILRHAVTLRCRKGRWRPHVTIPAETVKRRKAMEAFWKDSIQTLLGSGVHDSPEIVSHRDRL